MNPFVYTAASIDQLQPGILEYFDKGHKPTLALVFSSVAYPVEEIGKIFATYDIDVLGASSFAEIAGGNIREGSMVIMLTDIQKSMYRLNIFGRAGITSYEAGQEAAAWSKTIFENPGLIIVTAFQDGDGDQVVSGIRSVLGNSAALFGGMAGNDTNPAHLPTVYLSKSSVTHGIAVLAIDRNCIRLDGITSSGWKGIGTFKTVTRSEGNIVHTIDHQPAAEVYNKYLDVSRESSPYYSGQFGMQLERSDGSFITRIAMNFNNDGSILFAGRFPEGSRIRFSSAPGIELVQHTMEQLKEFHNKIPEADATVLFSCGARFYALNPVIEKETLAVSSLWKVPCAGFFTYGEYGPDTMGQCDYHNFTLSLLLMKEN